MTTQDEKLLDKMAKLKAMAEGAAAIGSEAEATAFAEMLQRLLLKHKLQMSDIQYAKMEEEEPVGEHWINYSKYPEIKVRKTRVSWMERLASTIAKAHFCRIMVIPRSSAIVLVGRKTDAEVAEYLIVTFQAAAERIADKEYVKFFYEARDRGRVEEARGFRSAFLMSFIQRLAVRYEAEKNTATGNNSMALVRINKAETAVNDWFKGSNTKKAGRLSTKVKYNPYGVDRGIKAANGISLRANAIKSGTTKPQWRLA